MKRTVLITGATSGIGEAIAHSFAQNGDRLVLTGRREERLSAVKDELESTYQATVFTYPMDVRDAELVANLCQKILNEVGPVDILVNNAGVSESTPFTSYTEADFDRVIDLNVKGVFNATRAVVDGMIKNHSGVVLNTSSMVSISGQPSGFAYPASKFAVNGTTISLARELGPKGIRVNAVAPGITETDMMKAVPKNVIEPMIAQIPLRRLGQPEDIANAFVFLASDEASYITGVVLSVDGMARA